MHSYGRRSRTDLGGELPTRYTPVAIILIDSSAEHITSFDSPKFKLQDHCWAAINAVVSILDLHSQHPVHKYGTSKTWASTLVKDKLSPFISWLKAKAAKDEKC